MKKALAFILIVITHGGSYAQPKPVVFTHATVIDATGGPAAPDMTVVIASDRIAEVGPAEKVRVPSDAMVLDARGKFLIPGLWDMHVHWYLKDYLPLYIANGITGVRQMNGRPALLEWRREMADAKLLGPRMIIASPIVDGPKPIWPNSIKVSNASEAREAVSVIKREGYDFIKVYHPIPRDAYFALADEAKKQGLSFVGHTPLTVMMSEASDAGQKSVEHLSGVLVACSKQEANLKKDIVDALAAKNPNPSLSLRAKLHSDLKALETYDDAIAAKLFERFVRNDTWHVPTLTILRGTAFPDSVANDPRLKYLPPAVRARSTQATSPFTSGFTKPEVEDGKKVYAPTTTRRSVIGCRQSLPANSGRTRSSASSHGWPGTTSPTSGASRGRLSRVSFTCSGLLILKRRRRAGGLESRLSLSTIPASLRPQASPCARVCAP